MPGISALVMLGESFAATCVLCLSQLQARRIESFFKYIQAFKQLLFINAKWRAKLDRSSAHSNGTEHHQSVFNGIFDNVESGFVIRLKAIHIGYHLYCTHQTCCFGATDIIRIFLFKMRHALFEMSFQFCSISNQIFFDQEFDVCQGNRAANRVAGVRGCH